MSVISFQNVNAVRYGVTTITKVMHLGVQVWPKPPAGQPFRLDLSSTSAYQREGFFLDNGFLDLTSGPGITTVRVPHNALPFSILSGGVYLSRESETFGQSDSMWLQASPTGQALFGSSGEGAYGSADALQSRYGGVWVLPTGVKAGDVAYVVAGSRDYGTDGHPLVKIIFT